MYFIEAGHHAANVGPAVEDNSQANSMELSEAYPLNALRERLTESDTQLTCHFRVALYVGAMLADVSRTTWLQVFCSL
jgi:hypothetical protein